MLSARNEGMPPEALRAALSPAFNPTGAFLVLLETDGRLIAASDTAEPYLDTLLSASVRLGDTPAAVRVSSLSGSVFLMGVRTANGAVIAGKSQLAYERSLESFRSLLRGWVLIPASLFFLFSLYLSHVMSGPADVLVRAAQKLSGGELVQVGEKLPPDLKPIGRAFNDMSLRLGQIMGALRYERDTMQLVL